MGKTPFLDKSTVASAYDESKKWMRPYFDPLDEFERIARNKPSPKIDPTLPKITDGTLAAIVAESPKRVVQQVPTALVECKDYPGFAKIADLELRDYLIPLYNRQGDMLLKSWNMISKSFTYGRATSYTFYTSTDGKMHTDFVIPYAKDVLDEKGKVFAPDCNIRFLRSWYQKRDLKAIINREKALMERDKKYKTDWDLQALADFMESGSSAKPADQQTAAEKEKGGDNGGYEVIHAFQEGIGAEFYSFAPRFNEGKPLRTKINPDPRGKIPLDDLYNNVDLSNPLGRGQVELSGGVQNLIDQQMQMFQFMTTLEMAPPLQTWGTVNKASLKLLPNAIWDMGTQPNNKVEPYAFSNFALQNFPGNYGLLKSQIMNLNSSQDHSISADAGNPAQSKTQAGVQAAESRLGVSDNYVRKMYEAWFERQSETSINIHFAEMRGERKVQLKGDDLKEIQKSEAAKYVDAKGVLTIPYKDINKITFKLDVDPSSSEVKEDADNVDKLTEVYKILQSDPDPSLQDKKTKLLKILINEIGAEGTDDLFPEDQMDENGQPVQQQPQQPQVTPQMVQQMVMEAMQQAEQAKAQQPKTIAESLAIKFSDLPEDAKQQVLQQIGINSSMPSPQNIDQTLKAHDSISKATLAEDQHQHTVQKAAVDTVTGLLSQQQQTEQHQADQAQAVQQNQAQAQAQSQNSTQDQQPLDHQLSPEEQQIVEALTHRGFDENDIEQAIVMVRQGVDPQQIMATLAAKRGAVA